jgi:uncharacterized delta-60 repeat protein
MDTGVILTTGAAIGAQGENANVPDDPGVGDDVSMNNQTAGDDDLATLIGLPPHKVFDAAALIFDFIPDNSTVSLELAFASEEYNDWVTSINDAFGFFIQYPGSNVWTAITCPVTLSVKQVNTSANPTLFINNSPPTPPAPFGLAYDGFSVSVTYRATVIPAQTHKVKLVIADASDAILDSAVFLKEGSFTSSAAPVGPLDTTFDPGTGANTTVNVVAVTKCDQKVMLGGAFSQVNGVARSRIARLLPNGGVDLSFNCSLTGSFGMGGSAKALVLQPDGKILVGGDFSYVNGQLRRFLARLNVDGTLDATFAPVLNGAVTAIAIQPDNKIIIGGGFSVTTDFGEQLDLARLNPDGTLDGTFSYLQTPEFDNYNGGAIMAVSLQSDGRILVGGNFDFDMVTFHYCHLVRLESNGSIDLSFMHSPGASDTGPSDRVESILVQPNNQIVIGGHFAGITQPSGYIPKIRVARLNIDGSVDASFNPGSGPNAYVSSMALSPCDGKILIAGNFTAVNGTSRNRIARLNSNGTIDGSFDPGTGANSSIYSLALQADGKPVIGGLFTSFNGTSRSRIARLNPQ